MEKIHTARRLLARVQELLARAGEANTERPLTKRCDAITTDEAHTPELREQLTRAMEKLDTLLDSDFRVALQK